MEELKRVRRKIVEEFLIKQGWDKDELDYEISDDVIFVGDYIISFSDIFIDLDKNVDPGDYFKWYHYDFENIMDNYPHTNYISWLYGFRLSARTPNQERWHKFKKIIKKYYARLKAKLKRNKEFDNFLKQHYNNPLGRCI